MSSCSAANDNVDMGTESAQKSESNKEEKKEDSKKNKMQEE